MKKIGLALIALLFTTALAKAEDAPARKIIGYAVIQVNAEGSYVHGYTCYERQLEAWEANGRLGITGADGIIQLSRSNELSGEAYANIMIRGELKHPNLCKAVTSLIESRKPFDALVVTYSERSDDGQYYESSVFDLIYAAPSIPNIVTQPKQLAQ